VRESGRSSFWYKQAGRKTKALGSEGAVKMMGSGPTF
jgi:hypothetical protein